MKVLLINGSPNPKGNTALALEEMCKVFSSEGIEAEIYHINHQAIRGCIGCGGCETRCPFGVPVAARMEKTAELFGF